MIGFQISFQGELRPYWAPSLPSVKELEKIVQNKIQKECAEAFRRITNECPRQILPHSSFVIPMQSTDK